jgi:GPN-loop GTPase
MTALNRRCTVINLDPANDPAPYPSPISLFDLITVRDAMKEYNLGPNGAMLFCLEYLEENFDWLEERIKEEGIGDDDWVIFDCPGQVELGTNHDSLKNIVDRLGKIGFRVGIITSV